MEDEADEAIWNKFMKVSNWIDHVFFVFDAVYDWKARSDGPKNTKAGERPSLRSLYAYFIDSELSAIEKTAAAWSKASQEQFEKVWLPKATDDAPKHWSASVYGPLGFVNPGEGGLRFPQPGTGGLYGCYGNRNMTFNGAGKLVWIGLPVPL